MRAFAVPLVLAAALCTTPVQAQDDSDQPQQQPTQGTIESVHLDAHARLMGTTCNPTRVQFSGRIKTNGPAFVTYRWLRSNGTHKDGELQQTAAADKTVSTSWDQTSTASGWVQLIVLTPKHVETPKSYFRVHCGTS